MKRIVLSIAAALMAATVAQAEPAYQPIPYGFKDCDAADAGPDICRLKQDPSPADALAHLGDKDIAFWRDGDRFTVVAKRKDDKVTLCCAIQAPLARWPGTDLWTLTVKSPHLDEAIIDISVSGGTPPVLTFGIDELDIAKAETLLNGPWREPPVEQWRGPNAVAAPDQWNGALRGALHVEDIASKNLGETRRVLLYLPPGYKKGRHYPVIYMADGQSLARTARIIETMIVAKRIKPIIAVGLYAGRNSKSYDRRAADYLIGVEPDKFFAHETFLLQEVMPLAERYGAASDAGERMVYGFSNGASWAMDMALRNPDQFERAATLSLGYSGMRGVPWNPGRQKLFLSAGLFEQNFLRVTSATAKTAEHAGVEVKYVPRVSGHSLLAWDLSLQDCLIWAFGAK